MWCAAQNLLSGSVSAGSLALTSTKPSPDNNSNPAQSSHLVHSQLHWNFLAPHPTWLTRTFVSSTFDIKIALHFPLEKCNFVSISTSLMCGNRREAQILNLSFMLWLTLNTLHRRAGLFLRTTLNHNFSLFQKPTVQSAMHYKFWAENLIYIFLCIPKAPKILIRDSAYIPRLVPQVCCKLKEKILKVTDVWVP